MLDYQVIMYGSGVENNRGMRRFILRKHQIKEEVF